MPSRRVTQRKVMEAIGSCRDPEIEYSAVELGLVRGVEIDGGNVRVRMIFVARNCPFHASIAHRIHAAVMTVPGVKLVEIEVDEGEEWDPSMMTGRAREMLRSTECGCGK